MNVSFACIVWN